MNSILFSNSLEKINTLPKPYNELELQTTNYDFFSMFNRAKKVATLNVNIVNAVINYFSGVDADICLVKISQNSYATEMKTENGTVIICANTNGSIRAALVDDSEKFLQVPNIYEDNKFDSVQLLLTLLPIFIFKFIEIKNIFIKFEENNNKAESFDKESLYKLSDAVYRILIEKIFEIDIKDGCFELLSEDTVKSGGFCYNEVICGVTKILKETENLEDNKVYLTVSKAKKEFEEYRGQFNWNSEEKELIPFFEDDFLVPEETIKIARRYVNSKNARRPMVNFMWRGITAYGKSTGVEVMANILNMPLLRLTCHSNMETQDFLSDFVPNTVNNNSDAPRFKHIESNYIKALAKGYIVEVQEISRIKDSGVLVGLNEYDRAGAIIPLVDGSFTRRNPNAVVVYTDNVGYNSCRQIDPSVIRRMSFIIDSYDMPREKALDRIKLNTNVTDNLILNKCYQIWEDIKSFCNNKGITEGSLSISELEMWIIALKLDGYKNFRQNCIECVVAKATSDIDEQQAIISSVVDLRI